MLHLIFSPIRMVLSGIIGLLVIIVFANIFGRREIFTTKMDPSTVHEFSWGRVLRNYCGLVILCIIFNIITAIL